MILPNQNTATPRSWYADTANPHPRHPPLSGELRADVCVIGGGFTGLMTALELAEKGLDVILIEAERIGWGASGRNGGQIITGYNHDMATIAGWVGQEDARRLWDFGEEAKDLLIGRVRQHDIDCDLRWGFLYAAVKERHMGVVRDQITEMRDQYGYDKARLLQRAELPGVIASNAYVGGLWDSGSGQIHPLNYALGLARAASAAGVRIFEDTRALSYQDGPDPVVVTGSGRVQAKFLVLAGNAYLNDLAPKLRPMIMPVATYLIATGQLGAERAAALLPNDAAISDMNFVLNYYRRSGDNRLLFGGGVSYSGMDAPGLKRLMRQKMLHVFPQLQDVSIEYFWGGYVAITVNRLPQLGRLSPTVYFAHGYSGHGITLTGMAGRLIAESISGQAGRFDVFGRIPHHAFPGGRRFRTPALVLAMLWYRLRDML